MPATEVQRDLSAVPAFLRAGGQEKRTKATSHEPVRIGRSAPGSVEPSRGDVPDPAALPIARISPRLLLQGVAVLVLAWGVVSFGRQVASASAASGQAQELRAANVALSEQVSAMGRELALIQERRYVDQQARAYRLGTAREIPFVLEANAPALTSEAPGSSAVRLGAPETGGGPLESWLGVLFGPER